MRLQMDTRYTSFAPWFLVFHRHTHPPPRPCPLRETLHRTTTNLPYHYCTDTGGLHHNLFMFMSRRGTSQWANTCPPQKLPFLCEQLWPHVIEKSAAYLHSILISSDTNTQLINGPNTHTHTHTHTHKLPYARHVRERQHQWTACGQCNLKMHLVATVLYSATTMFCKETSYGEAM